MFLLSQSHWDIMITYIYFCGNDSKIGSLLCTLELTIWQGYYNDITII